MVSVSPRSPSASSFSVTIDPTRFNEFRFNNINCLQTAKHVNKEYPTPVVADISGGNEEVASACVQKLCPKLSIANNCEIARNMKDLPHLICSLSQRHDVII